MKQPRKWKLMLLTWLIVYPLINLIFFTVMPNITSWHPLLKTLLVTIILVPVMGILMGIAQQRFNNWLSK